MLLLYVRVRCFFVCFVILFVFSVIIIILLLLLFLLIYFLTTRFPSSLKVRMPLFGSKKHDPRILAKYNIKEVLGK